MTQKCINLKEKVRDGKQPANCINVHHAVEKAYFICRMNEAIMNWSSRHFYQGKLTADSSVASRLLKDFLPPDENTVEPLVFIDTTGCDMFELVTQDEQSKANEGEAALVSIYVEQLVAEAGLDPSDIAIITPYNLQVELIRLQLREKYPQLEIRSVDGFQGREKEVVILSLVRSNPQGEVGFLAEPRRLNVAITRAKRHVAVIADVETLQSIWREIQIRCKIC